jgi:osmoprotectant transport system permease protein
MKKIIAAVISLLIVSLSLFVFFERRTEVVVGSKKFTESVILGNVLEQLAQSTGYLVGHRAELGGTRLLWESLKTGEIDAYVEYTGTLINEIYQSEKGLTPEGMAARLAKDGIKMSRPLGFNDTYALGMRAEVAEKWQIKTIGDLRKFPPLVFGLSQEFMSRADGWPQVQRAYHLNSKLVKGLDHDFAYRALASGDIHVMDLYSTDAEIRYYKLRVLEDNLGVFPKYEAIVLYRAELESRAPSFVEKIHSLENRIREDQMIEMNARAKTDKEPEALIAADFLKKQMGIKVTVAKDSVASRVRVHLIEHLNLVARSLIAAILVSLPLGIWAAKQPRAGQLILGVVSLIQTIPALALLVILIRPLNYLGLRGIGDTPAVFALFLYSLLPIVRNVHSGLTQMPAHIRESAFALGLPPSIRLWRIELPLASRTILAGIKTAAVINVGFATLGALVGAGGLGQPILTGIRLDDYSLVLQGALPAAALALLAQGLFELAERRLVPKGLRLA